MGDSVASLDERWYQRLKYINAQMPQRLKVGNYLEAKKIFFQTSDSEPTFSFPHLLDSNHDQKVSDLNNLLNDIEKCTNTDLIVKKLYREKIQEKLNQFSLLQLARQRAIKKQENSLAPLVEKVYGKPDQSVFNHLVAKLKSDSDHIAREFINSDSFQRLLPILDNIGQTDVPPFNPINAKVYSDKVFTDAREVRLLILERLSNLGLADWRVQISREPVGGFKVWPYTKRIIVPTSKMLLARKGERVLTELRLMATIEHEMAHALRSQNGLKSPLKLLAIGLAGYWPGEEGIASYREQQITGADDYANKNMHLAIGLAYGLDQGGKKRNFRDTFNLLSDYFFVFGDHNQTSAKNKAFAACERIYKLATGVGQAFIITKDIAYREGNIAIHQLLARQPEAEKWFMIGKFDPTNTSQVSDLRKLGIIV